MSRNFFAMAGLFVTIGMPQVVNAQAVSVVCEREDTMVPGWAGSLAVTYAGGPSGAMTVKSEHVSFTVPATQSERSGVVDGVEVKATGISGSAETTSLMPDAQALIDCATKSVQPEFKDDKDMQALALTGCVPKTAMGTKPVNVLASVTLGLVPGPDAQAPDVIVEIKRRYLSVASPSGSDVSIDTFPKDCKLVGR